jgi:predicted SAM-dependent methyltransferase
MAVLLLLTMLLLSWVAAEVPTAGLHAPQNVRDELMANMQSAQYVSLLVDAHARYSEDPFITNLLGNMHYLQGHYSDAARLFRAAYEQAGLEEFGYIKNYVLSSSQGTSADLQSAVTELALLVRGNRGHLVLFQVLRDTVVEAVDGNRIQIEWFIQQVLLELPERYEMWLLLAKYMLPSYISGSPDHNTVSVDGAQSFVTDPPRLEALLVLGLSVCPASPELLQLRALQYHRQSQQQGTQSSGTERCATHFAAAALANGDLWQSSPAQKEAGNAAMQTILSSGDSQQPNVSAESDMSQCLPELGTHSLTGYQSTHAVISSLYGDSHRWAALTSLHQSTDPTNIISMGITSTVTTAYIAAPPASATINEEGQPATDPSTVYLPSLQVGCSDPSLCPLPGFLIADAVPSVSTHFVTQAYNLSVLGDSSIGLLYSSHTLEHVSHNLPPRSCASYPKPHYDVKGCASEQLETVREWRRVLATGGKLLVSVPDLEALTHYFLHPATTAAEKSVISTILFGGQRDQHDFHKSGLFLALLQELLQKAGFCQIQRVPEFGLFEDTSGKVLAEGRPISLNVVAVAC